MAKNSNLAEMGHGAFMEQFSNELKRVLANIADPNTDPTKDETIKEELKQMQQNQRRASAAAHGVCWRPNRLLDHKCEGCPYLLGCTSKRKGGKKK